MPITKEAYGTMPDGRAVDAYTLDNGILQAKILTYGATLDALFTPDRDGTQGNVLLTFGSLEERREKSAYQGETVGPYANRIGGAKFTLNGKEHRVTANIDGEICLHSAGEYSHTVWDVVSCDDTSITLAYTSPDGTEGFPGTVKATAYYALDGATLVIDYRAVSDQDTILNLTNHAYFNFVNAGDILSHELQINADRYLPMSEALLPTGEIAPVAGTVFDFRALRPIRQAGYDHNFCLNEGCDATACNAAAIVYEPTTGRTMELRTNQPGVQFYCGNMLRPPLTGFCLETQIWPDCTNHQWPGNDYILRAGDEYFSHTALTFSAK